MSNKNKYKNILNIIANKLPDSSSKYIRSNIDNISNELENIAYYITNFIHIIDNYKLSDNDKINELRKYKTSGKKLSNEQVNKIISLFDLNKTFKSFDITGGGDNTSMEISEDLKSEFNSSDKEINLSNLPETALGIEIPQNTCENSPPWLNKAISNANTFYSNILNWLNSGIDWVYFYLFIFASIPFYGAISNFVIIVKALTEKNYFLAIVNLMTSTLSIITTLHIIDLGLLFKVFYYLDSKVALLPKHPDTSNDFLPDNIVDTFGNVLNKNSGNTDNEPSLQNNDPENTNAESNSLQNPVQNGTNAAMSGINTAQNPVQNGTNAPMSGINTAQNLVKNGTNAAMSGVNTTQDLVKNGTNAAMSSVNTTQNLVKNAPNAAISGVNTAQNLIKNAPNAAISGVNTAQNLVKNGTNAAMSGVNTAQDLVKNGTNAAMSGVNTAQDLVKNGTDSYVTGDKNILTDSNFIDSAANVISDIDKKNALEILNKLDEIEKLLSNKSNKSNSLTYNDTLSEKDKLNIERQTKLMNDTKPYTKSTPLGAPNMDEINDNSILFTKSTPLGPPEIPSNNINTIPVVEPTTKSTPLEAPLENINN